MRDHLGRRLAEAGRHLVNYGHRVGRRHWTTGARLTRVGLRVHLTGHALIREEAR